MRRVGGLADTVVDASADALRRDEATGFMFDAATPAALAAALRQAAKAHAQPRLWQKIMLRGMAQRFSWEVAAAKYMVLYKEAVQATQVMP